MKWSLVAGLCLAAFPVAAVNASSRSTPVNHQDAKAYLTPVGTIRLPGVEGRMDHLAADAKTGRLFVSALENHSLEVVDLFKKRRLRSIAGLNEPQGVLFVPRTRQLLVCSRGDGTCRTYDARTFAEGPWVDLGCNADNLRLDTVTNTVYVGSNGEPGPGKITAVDATALLPLKLGGKPAPVRSPADFLPHHPGRVDAGAETGLDSHPESMQIDAAQHRLFVNDPDEHLIVVMDTADKLKITARWPVPAKKNFPMAFNAAASRLYVACRIPAKLLTYDTKTGKLLSQTPCVGDADDLYFDNITQHIYVIGGGGSIDVFDTKSKLLARVPTASRARTGIYMPSLRLIAVAVPHAEGHAAAIRLFRINR